MRTDTLIPLLERSANSASSKFAKAMDAIWRGEVHLPTGVSLVDTTQDLVTIRVSRPHFNLEYNSLELFGVQYFKLPRHFLIPASSVRFIEITKTTDLLRIDAICSSTKQITLKEAKRHSRSILLKEEKRLKRVSLPPGIHHPAALKVTATVRTVTVRGGLPSLGKRK